MTRRIFCKVLLVVVAVFGLLVLSGVLSAQGRSEEAFEHVKDVQERNIDRLMAIDGVEGTAIGLNLNDRLAIKVFTAGPGVRGIPQQLDGVPVQVVVTGKIYALVDPKARFPRPVPIGVSTGHPDITAGTIGCRVTDGSNVYALSNNHVYADENLASLGDNVLQPGAYDGGQDSADAIGTLFDFEPIVFHPRANNTIDAAIALSDTDNLDNATPSDGYGIPSSSTAEATLNLLVKKYGRTTGQTNGVVTSIYATVRVRYSSGSARFVDQIIIESTEGGEFSAGGDSGSLIVTQEDNNPVGLLFAGNSTVTVANRIDLVLERFSVTVDDSEGPVDNQPSVSITSPYDGDTVSGTIDVTADASDDNGVVQVEFFVDGTSIGVDLDESNGWATSWDSTFVIDGACIIKATATDTASQTASDSISVTVDNVNDSPVADAGPDQTVSDADGSGLESVTLDGSGSYDPDGTISAYSWIEGGTILGTSEVITYDFAVGIHTVTLTVIDDEGATGSDEVLITVNANEAPIADAGLDQSAFVDETVTFDGSASYDPDGFIASYDWDFGDGATGSGITTTHDYSIVGTYNVILTVTDNDELMDTDEVIITVTEAGGEMFMHVADIAMSIKKAGINVNGIATVTVVDADGAPVAGATVSGFWSGATSDSDVGTTDTLGKITLQSNKIKNASSGTIFTFTVDNVVKLDWYYDSGANVETSDSTTVP